MKIAFVIPWYGKDIPGGAESECRETALHLKDYGIHVEILTTCIKDSFSDRDEDFHNEGVELLEGLTVRRFGVKERNEKDDLHPRETMINSPKLYEYIEGFYNDYDFFIFIPYLFGTTYVGSKACKGKAILIPCLHDESHAYMSIYKEMFQQAKGIIFLSQAEQRLAKKLYGESLNGIVLGGGIDTTFSSNVQRFLQKYSIHSPFILYAGRKDPGKNTPLLIDYFRRYKRNADNGLKLVFMGSGDVRIPWRCRKDIIDLGFVPVQDKYDAYSAALCLCQPSLNESFSLVVMESWCAGTPVLVHGGCEVTKDFCMESNGGLYFSSYAEFAECIDFLMNNPHVRADMGLNGCNYVKEHFSWDRIITRLISILEEWKNNASGSSPAPAQS
ncbi:MAG: glycosyltransferase family 4 protein [Nitrospirae bacterium]|nr:glycosyltransferase family 4 protein [Nitrospirota bacterium]